MIQIYFRLIGVHDMRIQFWFFASICLLVACSSEQDEKAAAQESVPAYAKEAVKAVHEPLDQAKGVEQMIMDQAEQQRTDIEQATSQ
jgi:hypothetical protein